MEVHKILYGYPTLLCTNVSTLLVMIPDKKSTSCNHYISDGIFNFHFWLVYAASVVMVHVFFVSFKNRLWDDPSRIWIPTTPYKKSCFPKNPQYIQRRLCRKARSEGMPNPTVSFAKFVQAA
jgi:hypothetical protein